MCLKGQYVNYETSLYWMKQKNKKVKAVADKNRIILALLMLSTALKTKKLSRTSPFNL